MAVTGDLGGNPIVLENAAEEATLQRLVDLFQNKFADNSGVKKKEADAIKAATKETKSYQDIVDSTTKGMEKYEVQMKSFGTRLASTAEGIKNAGATLGNSFKKLGENGEGLGDALGAMTGPVAGKLNGLGAAGRIASMALNGISAGIGALVGSFNKTGNMFLNLTNSGASFGGSMMEMRRAANASGATMDQFTKAIQNNSQGLARFGGGTTNGALALSSISQQGTRFRRELLAMGVSVKDQTEFFADYMDNLSSSGVTIRSFGGDFGRVAKAAVDYRKNLQQLSELTGQSAKHLEEQQEAVRRNAEFNNAIAKFGPEVQAALRAQYAAGSEFTKQVMTDTLVLGTLGPKTAAVATQMGGFAEAQQATTKRIMAGETEIARVQAEEIDRRAARIKQESAQAAELGALAGSINNDYLKSVGEAVHGNRQLTTNAGNLVASLGKAEEAQNKAAAGTDQNLNAQLSLQQSMQNLSKLFEMIGTQLLDTGIAQKFIDMFAKGVEKLEPIVNSILNGLGDMSSDQIKLTLAGGIAALFAGPALVAAAASSVGGFAAKAAGGIASKIGSSLAGPAVDKAVTDGVSKMTTTVGDKLGGGVSKLFGMAGGKGAGGATGGILSGLAKGMASFGTQAPQILLGAATIAGVIAAIGAGIAAASWLTGKALPTLTDGLKTFETLDGDRLVSAAKGLAAVGAAMAAMGAGSAVGAVGSAVGKAFNWLSGEDSKSPADQMVELSKGVETFAKSIEKLNMEKMSALAGFVLPGVAGGNISGVTDRIDSARANVTALDVAATSATTQSGVGTTAAATAAQQPMQNTGSEHTALLQRLLDVQTRQGTETNDLLRRISNEI